MKHYTAYHNPKTMGYPAEKIDLSRGFRVSSNRGKNTKVGGRVWLFTSEGSPARYSVVYTFLVDEVRDSEKASFKYDIVGSQGIQLPKGTHVDGLRWFEELKGTRFYGHGVKEIKEKKYIKGLEKLLERYSR